MARKKSTKQEQLNIKPVLLKGPKYFVQAITSSIRDIQTTKVISTWVIESENLKMKIMNNGKSLFSGDVKWIGNSSDGSQGCVMCISSGKDLKIISPTTETVKDALLDVEKMAIGLNVVSDAKCSVCGKELTIFDEIISCPICSAKSHKDHILEWVKMKGNCPVCKKELAINKHREEIVAK